MKIFGTFGAFFCFVAVLAGAVGSHALKDHLAAMGSQSNYDLATRYMFYHGLALILIGIAKNRYADIPLHLPGWLFIAGSFLFQGNLYLLSLTEHRMTSYLTPFGGISLMIGWLALVFISLRFKKGRAP